MSTPADRPLRNGRLLIYRHPWLVRLTHWVNVASLGVLLLSGLQILCAHPAFYWGDASRFAHPIAAITSQTGADGEPRGRLWALGARFDTTGFLGASKGGDGQMAERAFPAWITLPAELDLGAGRRWHFFFAWVFVLNGALYLLQRYADAAVAARSGPRARPAGSHRPLGDRPSQAALRPRGGRPPLQCSAEARLPAGGVRAGAADAG